MAGKRKPRKALLGKQIAVRVPAPVEALLRKLLPLVRKDPELGPLGPWDRARLLRYLLARGAADLSRALGKRRSARKGPTA